MNYEELADFIGNKMRMSHIYQPAMILALLEHQGRCDEREIAKSLLAHDESQLEYYTQITNNMVGRVLRSHQIVERDQTTKSYRLLAYEGLTEAQRESLRELCRRRLTAFIEARGRAIYDHRRVSVGYIPGTLKYEVLKRARFRVSCAGFPQTKRHWRLTISSQETVEDQTTTRTCRRCVIRATQ